MKRTNLYLRFKNNLGSQPPRSVLICFCLTLGALAFIGFMTRDQGGFVAHEWGTFTSVQGGDGVLLDWRPLQSSQLPKFVYDWRHPGLNRQARGAGAPFTKVAFVTLQRMETPVIYFYSKTKQPVDVTVDFPKGTITEWYPQATKIGPSATPVSPTVVKLDQFAHKVGAKPTFTFASFTTTASTPLSRARWANIEILPTKQGADATLLFDKSGSHYFAARDTDANYLEMSSLDPTNPAPEHEKFIFYRGAGNFSTPLRVAMTNNTVSIANTGTEPLTHLFLLGLENRTGTFRQIEKLEPGETKTVQMNPAGYSEPVQKLSSRLGKSMAGSLVSEGLYDREAAAMVNTWKDSWFEEDGLRVLYILPRAWTDSTLPLKMDPAPRELVRVMVGRAEVLTPAREQKLSGTLTKAHAGDSFAVNELIADFKALGRFAEPALRLATRNSSTEINQTAWRLFTISGQPQNEYE